MWALCVNVERFVEGIGWQESKRGGKIQGVVERYGIGIPWCVQNLLTYRVLLSPD
jgi:hypothetical protein